MLVNAEKFINTPVMSLQTGSELARTASPVINPYDLSIVAYELSGPQLDQNPSLLRVADIREVGPLGIIIDSSDELISPSDVIKIKELYEMSFSPDGIKVIDDHRKTVGKVIGYTIEAGLFTIQQLRVKRPLLLSFSDVELLIHRSQIIHIDVNKIVVKSPDIRKTQAIPEAAQTFENPFRKQRTQSSTSQSSDV